MPYLFRIFLLVSLFINTLSYSQGIAGIVKDSENGEPLEGVHIFSTAITFNTVSDKNGHFTIYPEKKNSRNDSISFSSVGYQTRHIKLSDFVKGLNEIFLTPSIDELEEVTLQPYRILQKKIKFTEIASMPHGAYSFGSVHIGNSVYIIGGDASRDEENIKNEMGRVLQDRSIFEIMNDALPDMSWWEYLEVIQVYDLIHDRWDILPIKIKERVDHNVIHHNEKLYILGGKTYNRAGNKELLSHEVEVLDLATQTIKLDPVNPHQAAGAAAVAYNEDLLVMGGSIRRNDMGLKTYTDDIHLFNFKSGLWFNAGKMPVKKETKGVRMGSRFFLIGGNNRSWLSNIEALDLLTGKWEHIVDLPHAIIDPVVVAHEESIFIYERRKFHVLDTHSREIKTYRIDLDVEAPAFYTWSNQLFLLGGYEMDGHTKKPHAQSYKVDLTEFDKTEVSNLISF